MATDPPMPDLRALLAAYDEREVLLERIREDAIRLLAVYDAQAARLAAVEQRLCDWQDHLKRVHHTLCDFPFRTELPDDYKEEI